MNRLDLLEDYFVRMHRKYGICRLSFDRKEVEIEDRALKNMVFRADDFNTEYEALKENCRKVFRHLKRGFSLKVREGWNNEVYVTVE